MADRVGSFVPFDSVLFGFHVSWSFWMIHLLDGDTMLAIKRETINELTAHGRSRLDPNTHRERIDGHIAQSWPTIRTTRLSYRWAFHARVPRDVTLHNEPVPSDTAMPGTEQRAMALQPETFPCAATLHGLPSSFHHNPYAEGV